MGEIYSITGFFYEDFPGISPWGGYFIRGREGDPENQIVGQLIDLHGPSSLKGVLEEDSLEFEKQYEQCNHEQLFDYRFSLKDGIWQGEWSSPVNNYIGKSVCKTNLCLGNINFERVDLGSPEGFAKALIDSMIRTGYLETYKDPDSGEEMIKPVE